MSSRYPKGSEWRRWDLHIHTPASTLHNEFGGWDTYKDVVESADSTICALGVTDYASIDGYKMLRKEIEANGRLKNLDLVLPNIEFRVSPFTKKGAAINLHLLIDPTDPAHIKKIEDALSRLSFKYQGGQKFPCTPDGLTDLGKAFDPTIKDDAVAYREGVNQFKPDFDAFRDWYDGEQWLKRNSVVALSNSSTDGASGLNHDDGYKAKRQELYRFSDLIFSGNPKDRVYFLGQGADEEKALISTIGGRKPCIHGSDAHREEKLFAPDADRYCWIKSDPTFEGLRQILYEPEARIHIGKTYPETRDENRIISSIQISHSNGWFQDTTAQINPALVSIIGSKGSGKTALVDLIAYATGSWTRNSNSFLFKAHKELEGAEIVITWAGGTQEKVTIPKRLEEDHEQKVRYLSQQFVEDLCSEDKIGTALVGEIEQVIFEYIDDTEKLGETSFADLRAAKTTSVRSQQARLRASISRLNEEMDDLATEIESREQKAERLLALQEERKGLERQKPSFDSEEEQKVEDELSRLRETRQKLVTDISAKKRMLERIAEIEDRISSFSSEMNRFYEDTVSELTELGIGQEDLENFRPSFRGDVRHPLETRRQEIRAEAEARTGTDEDKYPETATLRAIESRIRALEDLSSADQAKKDKGIEIQTRLSAIDSEIDKLGKAIALIDGAKKLDLQSKMEERWEEYLRYFDSLKNEQEILESLYQSLGAALGSGSDEERSLEFYIKWNADIDGWANAGDALLDKRKQGPYRVPGELAQKANELLEGAWRSGNNREVRRALEEIRQTFDDPGGEYCLENQLLSTVSRAKFDDWLFGTDHIGLSYGIRYEGVELENLSPGTKGIVLLILYLEMDKKDRRPLLIDQPEENLDNESIYKVLTSYFRKAKQRRQIILITHNPNLVVNTDSEQVIVASFRKSPPEGEARIIYSSGALEHSRPDSSGLSLGTREKVCEILEGGERAFHMREKKYAFDRR